MKKKYVLNPNNICRNCETKFVGNFCPNCGQSTRDYEKPFGFIIYDLAGNIFAFDTRLWRTLKTILFKPGEMAKEFILGHRIRYMPPFRFYVFVSFVFFLLLNIQTNKSIEKGDGFISIDSLDVNGGNDTIKHQLSDINSGNDSIVVYPKFKYSADSGLYLAKLDTISIDSEESQKDEVTMEDLKKHPEIFISSFYKYFSWLLFLLMPAYAFMLWLFFKKKHKYFIGHLIFAVDQHAFLFIILSLILAVNLIFPYKSMSIENYLLILVPVYSIFGAKNLYLRSWLSIIFKLGTIFLMYLILLFTSAILALVFVFI